MKKVKEVLNELKRLQDQEKSLWFAMSCICDLILANEKAEDPEEVRKEYDEFLKQHLDHLEDLRSEIARKEMEYESRNKNK